MEEAAASASMDLLALTARDPASGGSWRYVLESYAAYRAVLAHRLAHAAYRAAEQVAMSKGRSDLRILARSISEVAKVATGVEIHPAAEIGQRFVLDHGVGTVIGETTVIGDDCYILQGVVIGAVGISGNSAGKRHPSIGDRVEIGAFARILGPVSIGSDCLISPHALVLTDVPGNSRVRLVNQCQVQSRSSRTSVFAVIPTGPDGLEIHGVDLMDSRVDLIDRSGASVADISLQVVERDHARMAVRFVGDRIPCREILRLTGGDGTCVLLTQMDSTWRRLSPTAATSV
ncbi:serine O-acetyltransferase [Kitasatospora sp. NPDC001540]|uniref:serine O-acetyltransferase n=1 Tax=Kitasatospora sp. NPDC001540 TaxID=3364014 RepID=UPI00368F339D